MSITGAVLISIFFDMIVPPKWAKYMKIITGFIIITTIMTPVVRVAIPDFTQFKYEAKKLEIDGTEYQKKLIGKELAKNIENDIQIRIKEEYGIDVSAKVIISINENNEITGIKTIVLSGQQIDDKVKNRLKEIYSPEEVIIDGFKKNR